MAHVSAAVLVAVVLATTACGKKGPPLAPFDRTPAEAKISAARRVGNDVYVTVTVPAANVDASSPASVQRVDVFAATMRTPPPRARFLEIATLVATVPVARAADPGDRSGTVVPDPSTGALQGASVTVRDSLSADEMVPRELPVLETPRPGTDAAAPAPQALRRFYLTVPVSDRQRVGAPSALVEVPLPPLPEAVLSVHASFGSRGVVLQWVPSGGLIGWLLERALPPEVALAEPPVKAAEPAAAGPPTGPTLYNVYRELAADPLALPDTTPAAPWTSSPAVPVNAAPIALLTYVDDVPVDQRQRCYQVRAVRGSGAQLVESVASARACIVPVDTDPPAAPAGLTALPIDGGITLNWEANVESDLGGYIVLRREAADDTLTPLTPRPIRETRFADPTVVPGRMYTYVVQAVDSRIPLPNVSDPAEVMETAR